MTNSFYKNNEKIINGHAQHIKEIDSESDYHVNGLKIYAPRGVYHPSKSSSSIFLMDYLIKMKITKKIIIEIGTGTGVIAVYLAKRNNQVIASDISELCCAATCWNASENETNLKVIKSNLWENINSEYKADIILFNPPLLDKEIGDENELALCDPKGKIVHQFLSGIKSHLNPSGEVYMLHSNISTKLSEPWQSNKIILDTMIKRDGTIFNIISFRRGAWR